ncbi:MAG TPA: PstS family phosphate ABC transporter substrate-binding protein [Methanosarcinales archaeon]|nr:PstS family phosphate ABC transporter substrate-binding protein [Methanosarcinales archaeon]
MIKIFKDSKKTPVILITMLIITSLLVAGCIGGEKRSESIIVKGSDTILPLAQALAEEFMNKYPDADVTVIGGGSGVGIAALIDGSTDIADASRKIKDKELENAKAKGVNPVETVIAWDGIGVVVHPNNLVSNLTLSQIRGIYKGSISNWKEVGGADKRITVISRDSSSGTYEYFKEHALSGDNYRPDALTLAATGAIVQSVSQNEGAIGYIGLAYLDESVKALSLSKDGIEYAEPTIENVLSGKYPLARELYQYTNGEPTGLVKQFIEFELSPEGQKIVREVGYIPVK